MIWINEKIDFLRSYAPFVFAGIIGAIVHRLRKNMTLLKFIKMVLLSIFVGVCCGIVCRDYFSLPDNLIFVICSLAGAFAEIILDELEEGLEGLSDVISAKLGKIGGSKKQKDTENKEESFQEDKDLE